ncbi:hypothetical protein [Serratia sp. OPWLW2]|uniref:hypothetical protein n=1 Tax=Serratia sp. OPWLW2 TaxID=1928658 RepID=UPI001186172A|nr:hypothetical protein [Serratia sp. OPWLW2]
MTTETSPTEERIEIVNKLVSIIRENFTDAEINYYHFPVSMWLAMQMLCGPVEAARVISVSQIAES